jgi:colanic acid/amylovoran biosynthesis glycosyltransferase
VRMAEPGPPAIAYVVSRWGEPTQTFVRREAAAVAESGCAVRVLSLKRPLTTEDAGTADVRWLGPVAVLVGALRALASQPAQSLSVMADTLRHAAPRNLPSQLAAAFIGLAWAGHGLARDRHVHAHFGWVSATAAWATAAVSSRPFSVVLHAFDIHDRRRVDRFTPVPLRHARQVFVISRRDEQVVHARWGLDPALLRMGVPAAWLEDGDGFRDPWLVVTVGSLLPKKGHAVLLEALSRADPRWKLVLVGDGPLQDRLEQQVTALGLDDRVTLLGPQSAERVREWLQRAAASCLASVETPEGDRDGIPVALMEAMACGAVVVGTDVGAVRELVEGAGLLVPPGDPVTLAAALDRLRDGDLRARLVRAGQARIRAEFVAERAAAPVVALLEGRATPAGHGAR